MRAAGDVSLVDKALGGLHAAGEKVAGPLGRVVGGLMDIGRTAAGVAIGSGLAQLPGMLLDFAKGAASDEQAMARLSQSIKNLGGDFNAQLGQVNAAIAAGQKLAFTDDQIRDSYQFLAAATGSHTEALSRQQVAMDLARGAGISLEQASKLVGKVTEENVQAFKRMGITIAEGASEQEALAAIQAKFAGQADTFAQSTAGQFEQAKIAISEVQESIGSALLPVLSAVGEVLSDNLPAIQEFVGGLATGVSDVLIPAVGKLVDLGKGLFSGLTERLRPLLDVLPDIGTALNQAVGFFTTGAGDIETFRGVLNRLLGPEGAQMAITVFTNLSGFFRDVVAPAFEALGGVVQKVLGGDFGAAFQALGALIAEFGPKLITTLADWGQRFIAWVAPMIPPLLAEAQRLGEQLIAWVIAQGPPLLAQLQVWGQQLIAWIGPMIPPLLAEVNALFLRLVAWITEQGPSLLETFLGEWLPNAIKWVSQAGLAMIPELVKFAETIQRWLEGPGGQAIGQMFLKFGEAAVRGMVKGIVDLNSWAYGELLKMIQGWANDASKAAPGLANSIGAAIVAGIQAGIAGAWESFKAYLANQLTSLVEFSKRQLRISSPSQVFADEVGRPIVDGILAGIQDGQPQLLAGLLAMMETLRGQVVPAIDAITEAAERSKEAVGAWLESFRESPLAQVADQAEAATWVIDGLTEAMEELAEAIGAIPSLPDFGGGGGGGGGGDGDIGWHPPGPGPIPGLPFNSTQSGGAPVVAAGGATIIHLTVNGSILTERDLIDAIHAGLVRKGLSQGGLSFSGALT